MFPNLPYKGDQIPNAPFSSPEVPATFDRLFGARVPNIQLDPNPSDIAPVLPFSNQWVRPEDWLPLPSVVDTEEKFVGLFAILNAPENYVALQCQGDFTVDWGDGSVESYFSGDKAQHSYAWADISETTLTTRGYKQVLITVTAQAEANLTYLNLSASHDNVLSQYPSSPWLDIVMSMPNAASGDSIVLDGTYHNEVQGTLNNVERVQILNSGQATDFQGLLYYSSSLREFVLGNSVAANLDQMFSECYALTTVRFQNLTSLSLVYDAIDSFPEYRSNGLNVYLENISGVTDASYALAYMDGIKNVVINGMPDVTDMSNMFDECPYLETVTISNVPNLTTLGETFEYCYSLKSAVIGNCPALEETSYMFYDCEYLESVTFGETPSLKYTYGMFEYCYALFEGPVLDMTYVEDAESMYYDCTSIRKVPNYSTPALTSAYSMFSYCTALLEAPEINLEGADDLSGLFYGCTALTSVPAYDFTAGTNFGDIFYQCPVLQSAPFTNVSASISFSGCLLGRDAIIDIFQGLSTVPSESETVDVSNNYGAADLLPADIAIAQDKGWIVSY